MPARFTQTVRLIVLRFGFLRTIPRGNVLAFGWHLWFCHLGSALVRILGTFTPSHHAMPRVPGKSGGRKKDNMGMSMIFMLFNGS